MFSYEDDSINESDYIYYNSLVSIKLVSDQPKDKDFYMLRMENLDQSLILKRCDTPLLQYSDLKESLFYIRNIDECLNIFGNKNNNPSINKRQNLKEYVFKNDCKLNFNQNFILQHLMSKKFISIEKVQGTDNYMLKLVVSVEKALTFPFSFKRINSSNEFLTYKNIVYISIYNKEKGQNYYLNHNNIELEEINDEEKKINNSSSDITDDKKNSANLVNFGDLCVINYNFDKFYIINQNWYVNDKESLYNGQLVNIIFTGDKSKENDKRMLAAEGIKAENKIEEFFGIKEEVREDIDGLMRDNNQKYIQFNGFSDRIKDKVNLFSSIIIKGIPYKEDLYEHVINNSFWVIEKATIKQDELDTRAIEITDLVKIKNPLLGLYLAVKRKNKDLKYIIDNSESNKPRNSLSVVLNNSNIISNKNTNSKQNINNNINNTGSIANNNENEEIEFELITEEQLTNQYFNYNFKFYHYNVNEETKMSANGKYILKTEIINENNDEIKNKKKEEKTCLIKDDKSCFEPLSLSVQNGSDYINIKIEDDYILDISKVDTAKGNEVIFLLNVISDLDYILKNYKKKKASANNVINKITENINFFTDYLLNVEYMFKNDNFEVNRPVEERQLLLYNFNILNTIKEIINYFFPIVKDINSSDYSFLDKKSENNFISNMKEKIKPMKKRMSSNQINGQPMDEDSKIKSIKLMLKLLLKFLIYLSKNKENIKQEILNNILTDILEFSDYIYINEKTDLLNFIFDLLNDSEFLQESIFSKKFKQHKNNDNDNENSVEILFIDKILSYIETNCNYLFYYKKMIHLNKIRYKEEEIKQKIKENINKVENDFRLNKYKNYENYKEKIYSAIKNITNLVNKQIKEWNKYIDNTGDNENKEKKNNNEDNESDSKDTANLNKIFKRAKQAKQDEIITGKFKSDNKIQYNPIKGSVGSKKINIDEDGSINPSLNKKENKYDCSSNDPLNGKSLFNPQKRKSLFNSANKVVNLTNILENFRKISNTNNKNITEKILESDIFINNYNNKNPDNELIKYVQDKIKVLNKLLDFIEYFEKINLDKILFRKEELFIKMLKSNIKDEILENNLNFIINGNVCFIKFINDIDFSIETTIGSILPYYIFNTFFENDSKKFKDKDNEDKFSIGKIKIIHNNMDSFTEENVDINNKDSEHKLDDEVQEENEEEEKENDIEVNNNNDFHEDDEVRNIEDLEFENKSKEEEEKNNSSNEIKNDKNEKKMNIFIDENKKSKNKRRFTSDAGYTYLMNKQMKIQEEEKDIESNKISNASYENTQGTKGSKQRLNIKHKSEYYKDTHFKESINNLIGEESKKNDFLRLIEKCREDNQKINKYLYILYSIYLFCANEFIEINYKFFKSLINYYINYERFCKLDFLKRSLDDIKRNILNKIEFINKDSVLNIIFSKIKANPTLLNDNFDLKNFVDNNDNYIGELEKENEDKNNNKIETTIMNNNEKLCKNENWLFRLKKLSNEEIIIVDFLIYYCKINDKINYLIEKIECFKNIQKSICYPQNNLINNKINEINTKINVESNEIIKDIIKNVMKKLISNKFNILSLYEKLNIIKNKFLNSNKTSIRNNLLEDYGIFKQADFMLWLLEQYEIDRYFNKIIYLEINKNMSQDKNSFDKLMNIKELFQIIESEIHKAKEENEMKNTKENKECENHYKIICNKLMTMTKKVLLNIFSGKELRKEKIIQMLIKENENFFVKIGFLNTLKIMIESIEIYDIQYNIENNGKNENNYILKLNYCKEILRCFLEIQNTFPKFNKLICENISLCKQLIINSLKSIKDFQGNDLQKTLEEEKAFLCICYYCSEILLFLLGISKNTFTEIHGFVMEIFNILKNIYDYFHSQKNIVTYQLFYNYLVIRISLLLNKSKNKDSFSLEYFFKSIYDIRLMKDRILDCIAQLQSSQENSTKKTDNKAEKSSEYELKIYNDNEEEEFEHWKDKLDKVYEFKMKKSLNSGELKTLKSKNKNNKNEVVDPNINNNDVFYKNENYKKDLMWESDEEKEKLMFFIYFTSIYIIYIKDKNAGFDDNDNNLEEEENNDIQFNFSSLSKKIKNLLDSQRKIDEFYLDEQTVKKRNRRTSLVSLSLKSSILTKAKINNNLLQIEDNISTFNKNTINNNNNMFDNRIKDPNASNDSKNNNPRCENRYNFELVLLETIAGYKYSIKNKIIEIPVKNVEEKIESEYSNTDSENTSEQKENEKDIDIEGNKKKNDYKIKFYYYDPNGVDLLFLEKIFKDIEVKKNLRYYCTNSFTNEEYEPLPSSKLLIVLFELQNRLESIKPQQKTEHKLLYDQFIKNDMKKFMKYLLNTFNKNDFENIDLMGNFYFNRFNEIYPYDSLYSTKESEKVLSLVETLNKYEFELENEYFNDLIKSNINNSDVSILNLYNNDIVQFLNSLIYLYPHYDKKICIIFFKTGFMLLYINCIKIDSNNMNKQGNQEDKKANHSELNLNAILNAIILLFSRKINHDIIETKNLFFLVLISINIFLRKIKDNHIFLSQNKELIQEFFHKIDFILKHLSKDFEKVVVFMNSTKSQQKTSKYTKIEESLNYLINFMTTLIGFKKIDKDILTEEITNFIQDIVEKIIELIDLLLEQNKESSFQTINLLLNFIYYFVEGPDIENFKTLFNKGYYDLVSHSINKIDYYILFFSNINKENLFEIIDNKVEQEYRIIKILLIFYCLCHYEYRDSDEFSKMRRWYEENFKNIKQKLKKIYYLSKKEMENREYDLNKMLLFLKDESEIIENYGEINKNSKKENDNEKSRKNKNSSTKTEQKIEKKEKIGDYDNINVKIKRNNQISDYCLIKFDLILIYYSLFNYYQDSFNDEFLSAPPKESIIQIIINFLSACFNYIKYIILCPFYLSFFIYESCTRKLKSKIELLQELSDIDAKCQILDEKVMLKFLTSKIKYIEVSLDYRLFKVYYPVLNKSAQIQENKDYYLKVDNNQLSNYVKYIMDNYDKINLVATQHLKIRKLFDLPAMNIIFKNDNLYSLFLFILGALTNIFVGLSYSTFTTESCSKSEYKSQFSIRVNCPHFLYKEDSNYEIILQYLDYLGIIMFVLQIILFAKYIIQTTAETIALYKNSYLEKISKEKNEKNEKKNSMFSYIIGFIPSFLKMLTSFNSIYFLLSLLFICLGIFIHPFFYCFVLFELVKRIEIMQIILRAMYDPLWNILTTILLCCIMEYFFAIIAVTIYQSHFPNINDTKNMINLFLRMFDQTFKQDGGVGTYLDITLEPGYTPFNARYYAGTRFFFDLIFFLLINMIAFQIFFMIIIDYFSQSKEKTEEFTELSETKCLICELEREELEKIYSNSKNAFELHINYAHSLVDYLSYLVYLQTLSFKDPIIEERIWKLHLSNNLNYLPKNVCFKQKEKEMLSEYLKK